MAGSVSGLISGLQTDEIIAKMLEFGRRPVRILEGKQAKYTAQLAAWRDVNVRLLALSMSAGALSNGFNFKDRSATSSDDTLMTATAGIDAAPGKYSVRVDRLAQAEQRLSQGYADTDKTTLGEGTITIGMGGVTKTITIDATNNTLSGLREAINRAGVGVSAGIVDFGSGTDHDYRLQLTAASTGAANAISWTADLAGGDAPSWTTTTTAQDAQIRVGPDGNTTTITKSTNKIQDVYPGLTLNLKAADAGKTVNITVASNTSAVKDRVKAFVDQYNAVMGYINDQFSFNTTTNESGMLFGDYALQNVQQEMRNRVLAAVPGLPAGMSTLSQIGITTNTKDGLVLDEAALDRALSEDPNGVMRLFANTGDASDSRITYLASTNATKETGAAGYTVRIDQAATQARLTAGVAQSGALAADETLTINGVDVALKAGMTAGQVADEINRHSEKTGVTASRTGADGTGAGDYLTLTRKSYGAAPGITMVSSVSNGGAGAANTSGVGVTLATLANAGGESGTGAGAAGQDVKGAYGVTVNGAVVWEDATGTGQTLSGKVGNAHTEGLQVRVASSATGEHGHVSLMRGVGGAFSQMLGFLTGGDGAVTTAQSTLTKQIDDLKAEIADKDDRLLKYEEKLRFQFIQLESSLGKLRSQGDYLLSQFTAMNNPKR